MRGGRREVVVEGAVVALEVDGEGVEVGGEDDDVVVCAVLAPVDGSDVSVIEDIFAMRSGEMTLSAAADVFLNAVRVYGSCRKRSVRCVAIRPTSGDEAIEIGR